LGEQKFLETTLLRKDGTRIIVEINGVLLPDGEVLGELRDITERKLTEQAVRRSRDQLTAILNSTTESIFHIDGDGIILAINDIAAHRLKSQSQDMIGRNVFDFFPAEVAERRRDNVAEVMRTGREKYTEDIRNHRFYSLNYYPVVDSDGKVSSVVVYAADITERKKVETELGIAATAFELQEGMLVTDANRVIIRVNWAFTAITGYTTADAVGKTPKLLSSGRHNTFFYASMWKSINETGTWEGDIWNRRKNGEIYPEHLTITAVRDQQGRVSNYVAAFADITEIKSAEEKIKNLAFYDSLTGLPNRRLLQDRLQQALSSRMRSDREGALLFIDLDNFKTLNDTLGHGVGDLLLQQVAQRLVACVREGDTVARLGGDEFVVMLEDLSVHTIEAAEQAEVIGAKILLSLNQTYQLAEHEFHSTSSIGATLFGEHQSIESLLQQADIAMYESKKAGRNALRFFDPKMQDVINERAVMESELRVALENHQFELYFQLQVDSAHRPIGAEALIRWNHPERGMISPALFIPLAEDTGAILPIGHWVLEAACAQLKRWQEDGLMSELVLAVNVSAKQFRQPGFVAQVQEVVTRYGIRPMKLKLELTESVVLKDVDDTIAKMKILKAFGVNFSMDDFGTGYSSLQYLKLLPLDQLKIDQSFVRDIATDSNDKSIVTTIIAMAQSMNLDVIAEGVETEEQRQFLEITGCRHFQGYLFSRPVSIAQFEVLLGQV
jgi:diguanylate cyclase (GGDEF)-like protein/PAS domain S-box-containing protein